MKKSINFSRFSLFSFLLLSMNSHALEVRDQFRSWGEGSRQVVSEFPKTPLFGPELATILIVSGNYTRAVMESMGNQHTEKMIKSTYSAKGRFKTYWWPQVDAKKVIKKAPLMVISSGIFSTLRGDEPFIAERMKIFNQLGYHVLVIPTVGGPNTMDDHSKVLPFHLKEEGLMGLELINNLVAEVGEGLVDSVHLIGLSYGATAVAVIAAVDNISAKPIISSATSISPIYNMLKGIEILDRGIHDNKEKYYKECNDFVFKVFDYSTLLWPKSEKEISPFVYGCRKALISYYGYQNQIKMYLTSLYNNRDYYQDKVNFNYKGKVEFLKAIDDITYTDYVKLIDQSFSNSDSPAIDLEAGEHMYTYWAKLAGGKLRVITSDDEILNENPEWFKNDFYDFSEANFLSLPWGGHGGFGYMFDWYKKFFIESFKI